MMNGLGKRRRVRMQSGYTLIEILVTMMIVALLASILFVLFARAKKAALSSSCISNLHQVGLAANLYQADWDGQMPYDKVTTMTAWKRKAWELLARYAKSPKVFVCPDVVGLESDAVGYIYRAGPMRHIDDNRAPQRLEATSVIAYCMDHLDRKVVRGPFDYVDYPKDSTGHYTGRFNAVRADASAFSVDAKQVETWDFDGKHWFHSGSVPKGRIIYTSTERFPDEPWPPTFEFGY